MEMKCSSNMKSAFMQSTFVYVNCSYIWMNYMLHQIIYYIYIKAEYISTWGAAVPDHFVRSYKLFLFLCWFCYTLNHSSKYFLLLNYDNFLDDVLI